VSIAALILFVLLYARAGALHGSRFQLFVAGPDANNLLKGSDVWLNGQRVGVVKNIDFNTPSAPPDRRVVIEMEVLSDVRPLIRIDSRATLRSGGTVIGAPVVYISSGSTKARGVAPGDTLSSGGSADLELAASRFTESMEQVPSLIADSKQIIADTKVVGSRLSVVMAGQSNRKGPSFSQRADAFMRTVGGRGSAGRLMQDAAVRARLARSMASMDTLRTLLGGRMDQVGRFRRDSTLAPEVRQLRADVSNLRELAKSPDGTIGRMNADSAVKRGLDSAFAELNALLADIKKHPLKYARF
jgi:ABC-type transport system involved in resistance to organic solvents, periplasmic component